MKAFIFSALLAKFAFAQTSDPYLVGAHYYEWYMKKTWAEIGRDPLLGHYNSIDDAIISQHLKWASEYGIDFFALEWSGRDNFTDQVLYKHFAVSPDLKNTKFCISYDTLSRFRRIQQPPFDFSNPKILNGFVSDFDYLSKRYFPNPSYLKFQGRPVVWMYIARGMKGNWKRALQQVRDIVRKNGFELYLDGDLLQLGRIDPERFSYFDAVSFYTLNERKIFERIGVRDTGSIADIAETEFPRWSRFVSSMHSKSSGRPLAFHPVITPQFSKVHSPSSFSYLLTSPDQFRRMAEIAKDNATYDELAGGRVIWITSWNEWYEGSTIEPTTQGDSLERNYGFKLLEIVRDVFR